MELTAFALLVCLGAGLPLFQGALAARYLSEGLNKVVSLGAAVCAVTAVAAFALHLGHPALLFNAFGNIASGITLFLYAAVAFVAMAAVFATLSFRSEDGSVPAWAGAALAVLALVFSACAAFGYLTLTEGFKLTALDLGSVALTCYFMTAAATLGAFGLMLLAVLKGDGDALGLARRCSGIAAVLVAACVVVYLVWFSTDANAAAQITKTTFDIQAGSFLVGGAVNTATAADKLAVLLGGSGALLFWGGVVLCGVVAPVAAGVAAWFKSDHKLLAAAGAAGLVCACVGVCSFVSCLGILG